MDISILSQKLTYPITRERICALLQCDYRTFNTWLWDIGIKHSRKLNPIEVEMIRIAYVPGAK